MPKTGGSGRNVRGRLEGEADGNREMALARVPDLRVELLAKADR